MTSETFQNEISKWVEAFFKQKRKFLLLIDNCPIHHELTNLRNIKVCFIQPNVTSILQLMDQGDQMLYISFLLLACMAT